MPFAPSLWTIMSMAMFFATLGGGMSSAFGEGIAMSITGADETDPGIQA